jgi:hypothetical protein
MFCSPCCSLTILVRSNQAFYLVGLMCQHPNPLAVADGPELLIRAVRGRRI